ncbi:SDR family oxidoreductase [Xanthovirga aplysinae]|uniref:SDR family oxidoreductase n=1 Tax=Xanthovirga aplysinae TaxID=2529853 RepID=UPI0012BB7ADA|nr:SDR family oxidoreductase [Xanthovirga aplysinae]MTI32871.1 SDR family oxidoreductase [Xanthovirga aplysinae]
MNIEQSRFIVTGGSKGIGKATAKNLIQKGGKVIITSRHEEELKKTANEIGAFPVQADVSNPIDIQRTIDHAMEYMGGLDGLINNAGIGGQFSTLEEVQLEDFQKVFSTNVYGATLMAQKAAQIFKAQKYGNIINIASTAALKGFERGTVYCASKAALKIMTQCWQAELRRYNIRVMLINPSEVVTTFGKEEGKEKEEIKNKLRGEEIAHSIVSVLEMDDRGFTPELTVFATNPF